MKCDQGLCCNSGVIALELLKSDIFVSSEPCHCNGLLDDNNWCKYLYFWKAGSQYVHVELIL